MSSDIKEECSTVLLSNECVKMASRNEVLKNLKKLNEVLKKLKDSEYISVFFLLIDFLPDDYLTLIKKDRLEKENVLRQIICKHPLSLLIEILGTVKRYDLLKLYNICQHDYRNKAALFNSIDKLWKTLFEICLSVENFDFIKNMYTEQQTMEEEYLEIYLIEAYKRKLFSKTDLTFLLTSFSGMPAVTTKLNILNGFYPISSHPCGIAVIINHENFHPENSSDPDLKRREESNLDVAILEKLWKDYGFEVQVHKDLDDKNVISLFQNLAEQDHSRYDVFLTCYMSHGNDGVVYSSNCKAIPTSSLIELMANACPTLVNKPKLFFIEACQGTMIQRGLSFPSWQKPTEKSECQINNQANIPLKCDCLKVVSSIPGYTSFVSIGKNSWFIQSLVENIKKFGNEETVLDIIVKVTAQVAEMNGTFTENIKNCKQTVQFESTLRKKLQLRRYQNSFD